MKICKDLLKVTRKVRERILSAADHFHRHQEEAAGTLVLWNLSHRQKTYVQVLLEETGLQNISQLISQLFSNGRSQFMEVYCCLQTLWWWSTVVEMMMMMMMMTAVRGKCDYELCNLWAKFEQQATSISRSVLNLQRIFYFIASE